MTAIIETLRALHDKRGEEIEHWFTIQRETAAPYFYSSVDLRHSGVRLVPVDTNLYPAGFNNLSPAACQRAAHYAAHYLQENAPQAKHILLVPENHTRNLGYLENLAVLTDILTQAGYKTRIGNLTAEEPLILQTMTGRSITQSPLRKDNNALVTQDGFLADAILLNNDLTSGMHPLLASLTQPIFPPPSMGWYVRRKTVHFAAYQKLAENFAAQFGLDSWLLSAYSHGCGRVDFKEPNSLSCVAKSIDDLLARTQQKYTEYGIKETPYIFVKADSGTYGMGIMTVQSGSEILELNKKERNKMRVIKEGARVSEVIIQEGIPTIDVVDGKPAEPMVYIVDGLPVGGMYRVNGTRNSMNNLNAAGMEFVGMCDEVEIADATHKSVKACDFQAYGLIAAIAALAVAREHY